MTVLPYYLENIMIGKSISTLNWPRAFDKDFYRLAWIIISPIIALVTKNIRLNVTVFEVFIVSVSNSIDQNDFL